MTRSGWLVASAAVLTLFDPVTPLLAAKTDANHFATVAVDGKKVGQVHFTAQYGEADEVEELKTRASMSVLGLEVYHFTQHLHEEWEAGELLSMRGETDDDGATYAASLDRTADGYEGELNGEPVSLPGHAFPASPWHYAITDKTVLIDLKDLSLMEVDIAETNATLPLAGKSIAATRFDFTGDWRASLWFDQDKQLVQLAYQVEGHDVVVTIDPG